MAKTQFQGQKLSPKKVLGAMAALFIAFLLLTSVINVAQKYFAIKKHIKELSTEHKQLQQKNENLAKTNNYLATDEGEEQALREKYNIVRPGEGMIIVAGPVSTDTENKRSNVSRFWDAILNGLGIKKD